MNICLVIVAVTANAFAEDKERYLKAGMSAVITKPFHKGDLAALLVQICSLEEVQTVKANSSS